jgi:hypothetical protein
MQQAIIDAVDRSITSNCVVETAKVALAKQLSGDRSH